MASTTTSLSQGLYHMCPPSRHRIINPQFLSDPECGTLAGQVPVSCVRSAWILSANAFVRYSGVPGTALSPSHDASGLTALATFSATNTGSSAMLGTPT